MNSSKTMVLKKFSLYGTVYMLGRMNILFSTFKEVILLEQTNVQMVWFTWFVHFIMKKILTYILTVDGA